MGPCRNVERRGKRVRRAGREALNRLAFRQTTPVNAATGNDRHFDAIGFVFRGLNPVTPMSGAPQRWSHSWKPPA